jgi:hypothetical protein
MKRTLLARLAYWLNDKLLGTAEWLQEKVVDPGTTWPPIDVNDPCMRFLIKETARECGRWARHYAEQSPWLNLMKGGKFPEDKGQP